MFPSTSMPPNSVSGICCPLAWMECIYVYSIIIIVLSEIVLVCVTHPHDRCRVDSGEDTVAPTFQIINVNLHLITLTVDVGHRLVWNTSGPSSAGYQTVQFREVCLGNWLAEINQTLYSGQLVTQAFNIVSVTWIYICTYVIYTTIL